MLTMPLFFRSSLMQCGAKNGKRAVHTVIATIIPFVHSNIRHSSSTWSEFGCLDEDMFFDHRDGVNC
jgi:hypothetical protein